MTENLGTERIRRFRARIHAEQRFLAILGRDPFPVELDIIERDMIANDWPLEAIDELILTAEHIDALADDAERRRMS